MTISMLKPEAGRSPAYDRFYLSYSMLISTNLVTHHLVHDACEQELAQLLGQTAAVAESDYQRAQVLYAAMGLAFDAVQSRESRGLDLAGVFGPSADDRPSAKQAILAFQNFNEFVLLFALFEDAVKEMLAGQVGGSAAVLKEPDVMSRLMHLLQATKVFDRFRREIVERTICRNYRDAEMVWDYFVVIRHLFVHSAGRPTTKWLADFQKAREPLLLRLKSTDIAVMEVRDLIEEISPVERRLLILPDGFMNFFRNFVVAVMEAVYVGTTPRLT